MINTKHLLRVTAAWISIVYVVCYGFLAIFSGARPWFMEYSLHMRMTGWDSVFGLGNFVAGLVFWNLIVFLVVGLFAVLFNNIKK
ncbi:MAG: hypothetical protein COU11_03875 [Candidatus Harrisonbacteria bacterium CG10_big_fil_rev_8_21_14_0_10_49_15]|uniref:Uncharacterized protein n=1 Tax=Candidatus Harrisonbacteria bacterium CG10_big_fil_rev_8_21_14_0_10_49_15 TaxID=1974587 RepID=A0A2H0UM08_9BACT|nr:MAG: hypothetical protein COU11_03875 [Candidatus Harrisonbacteria bacterium CG10_big_fil_rev_8_21_14_0_10_49_15]